MFRASLCPTSGEKDCVLPHMVFCTGCAGCGCVQLGRELCALCESYCSTTVQNSNFHTVHTARIPAPHNHSQHNQCRTPYAVERRLVLLMTGIMMPETCWDRSLIINDQISWILLVSLSPPYIMYLVLIELPVDWVTLHCHGYDRAWFPTPWVNESSFVSGVTRFTLLWHCLGCDWFTDTGFHWVTPGQVWVCVCLCVNIMSHHHNMVTSSTVIIQCV